MEPTLRLIAGNPLDQLARTIEALLVVASAPLSVHELADAADDDPVRVEAALGLVGERYREGRSGIVLEHVAGGFACRASREAAEACARLFERPAQRNLSPAAMETLAIVAYLQPATRAEIEAVRGVNVDSVVNTLLDRRFIVEAGRREAVGRPAEYKTTEEFLEAFGLRSLAELPPVDFDAQNVEIPLPIATEVAALPDASAAEASTEEVLASNSNS